MGSVCSTSNESYFDILFQQPLIRKITDKEYVSFIEAYLKTTIRKSIKLESQDSGVRSEQFHTLRDVLINNEGDSCEPSRRSSLGINDFKVELLSLIYEKFIISKIGKSMSRSEDEGKDKLSTSFRKHVSNSFFKKIKSQMKNQEGELIIALLFLTNSNLETICQSLGTLMKILKGKVIVRKENSQVYINIKSISEIIRTYARIFSFEAVDFASLIIENESVEEFVSVYKNIFGDETQEMFNDKFLDFTFIEESSLAYFLKLVYPIIKSPELIIRQLISIHEQQNENQTSNTHNGRVKSEKISAHISENSKAEFEENNTIGN